MSRELGQAGEEMAARYLKGLGYRVLCRNERVGGCEIDIVAQDGDETVFVEVKTRQNHTMGYPEESVTRRKRQHIARAAEAWLLANGDRPWRADVIAITVWEGQEPELVHIEGI